MKTYTDRFSVNINVSMFQSNKVVDNVLLILSEYKTFMVAVLYDVGH